MTPQTAAHDDALSTIRARAREGLADGVVVGDPARVTRTLKLLDSALATELLCTLRYHAHAFRAQGPDAEAVRAELAEHAREEMGHALRLAERIAQLGGAPDFRPDTIRERAHAPFSELTALGDLVKENLVAERMAIQIYRAMIQDVGDSDPTTRRLLEDLLASEEEHADDLADLLADPSIAATATDAVEAA